MRRPFLDLGTGGGCYRSQWVRKPLVLAILAILMVSTFNMRAPAEGSVAFTATGGSGTAEDPYHGTVTFDGNDSFEYGFNPDGLYFMVGTIFEVIYPEYPELTVMSFRLTDGFGIDTGLYNIGLVGTLTKAGEIEIEKSDSNIDMGDGLDYYHYATIYAVSLYDELAFESDPSDGILIPPNHHLVTFIQTDGTREYRVVEHGGHIEDIQSPLGSNRVWWDGQSQYSNDMVEELTITGDVTFTTVNHDSSGGASDN